MKPVAFKNTGYLQPLAEAVPPVIEAESSVPLPSFYKTDISALPVLMQGQQPACLAFSVTKAVMYYNWKKTGVMTVLSPRFLYTLCKQQDGAPHTAGTYLATALKIAQDVGICEEAAFPTPPNLIAQDYNTQEQEDAALASYIGQTIPQSAMDNAAKYKIAGSKMITDLSYKGLATAILQHDIVIECSEISSQWWETEGGNVSWSANDILPIRPADNKHPIVSGHAKIDYAFGTYIHGSNHWSTNWGYNGLFWYRADALPTIYQAAVILGMAETQPTPPAPQLVAIPAKPKGFWTWFIGEIFA